MEEINSLLKNLIAAREAAAQARATRRKFEEDPEYIAAVIASKEASAQVEMLETKVHEWGYAAYAKLGQKKLVPGVNVRMVTTYEYKYSAALDWARANLQEALALDTKFFEEYAKGVATTKPVPFFKIIEVPQVTIAKNLTVEPLKAEEGAS